MAQVGILPQLNEDDLLDVIEKSDYVKLEGMIEDAEVTNLWNKSVSDLRVLASSNRVPYYNKLSKFALIEAILEKRKLLRPIEKEQEHGEETI